MIAQVESGDGKKSRFNLACLTLLPGNWSSQRLRGGHTLAGLLGVYTVTGLEEPVVSGALSSLEALGVIFLLPMLLCLHLSQFSESHFCRDSGCTEGSSKILLFQPCQCTLLPKCIFLYILMFFLLWFCFDKLYLGWVEGFNSWVLFHVISSYSTPPTLASDLHLNLVVRISTKGLSFYPSGSDGKESAWNAGDAGLIPGSGRSPGEGNGYPLQYSCLKNPMDRGAWWAKVHEVTMSRPQLSDKHFPISEKRLTVFWVFCSLG